MQLTTNPIVAAVGLTSLYSALVSADFSIWSTSTSDANAEAPGIAGSYLFVSYSDDGIACADLENEEKLRYDWPSDVTASKGGVSADFDGETCTRFEYWDGETDDHPATMSESYGFITLRPEKDDPNRYYFDYVNPDRTESGVITNSYCVPAKGEFTCTKVIMTRTGSKLFDCYTSIEINPN